MKIAIEPRTGRRFNSGIGSDAWYLWDNYGYTSSGVTHIYSQAADRKNCKSPELRYRGAYWRHFISDDGGVSWQDEGPALAPSGDEEAYDGCSIWSGSVLPRGDGLIVAAYTGLHAGSLALQSLAIAVSEDGYEFERVSPERPLLSPVLDYEELRAKGYYLGPKESIGNTEREADGTFLTFRDPFLYDDSQGATHLFFGSKAMRGQTIVPAVGHALFTESNRWTSVEILPPQFVPDLDEFNLLELPNLFFRDGMYYLLISTSRLGYMGQPDLQAHKSVRLYRSDTIDGKWQLYGNRGEHLLLHPNTRLHGLSVINTPVTGSDPIMCRAFWVGESRLPPSLRLDIGNERPRLLYPDYLWKGHERP